MMEATSDLMPLHCGRTPLQNVNRDDARSCSGNLPNPRGSAAISGRSDLGRDYNGHRTGGPVLAFVGSEPFSARHLCHPPPASRRLTPSPRHQPLLLRIADRAFSISRPSAKHPSAVVETELSSSFPLTPVERLRIQLSAVDFLRNFGRRRQAKRSQHWAQRCSGEVLNPLIRQLLERLALRAPQAGGSRTTDKTPHFPAYPPGLWRSPAVRSLY
jgi:hypothetical protein